MIEFTKPEMIAVVTVLGSVVVALWKLIQSNHKNQAQRLEKVEGEHSDCNNNVIKLTEDVSYLRGQMDGIAGLSSSVLKKIEEINKGT